MDVEYSLGSESLCFYHAVKAVVENDKKVTASVPRIINADPYGTGYLGSTCVRCYPPDLDIEEEPVEEEEDDDVNVKDKIDWPLKRR